MKLSDEIYGWIPEKSMAILDVLNPFSWPENQKYPFTGYLQYRDEDIISLYKMIFEGEYELFRVVETDEFLKIWRDMLGKLTHDSEWCKMLNTNDVVVLLQHYLGTNLIPPVMKRLI